MEVRLLRCYKKQASSKTASEYIAVPSRRGIRPVRGARLGQFCHSLLQLWASGPGSGVYPTNTIWSRVVVYTPLSIMGR